ncbi:MAG: FAD-dependent oxidoreductase [Planctomycetes bacterium]|nr:FAD-dependent oxidoreductase [Planctomycetota bacterium]
MDTVPSPASLANAPELAVVGGGLMGCMAAVAAARRGRRTVVVEKRQYLGREVAACDHSFVAVPCNPGCDLRSGLVPGFASLFSDCAAPDELLLSPGLVRQRLQALLESEGVAVLHEAEAVAVSASDGAATGLLLACPTGLAWLPAGAVVDATERANLLRALAGRRHLDPAPATVRMVLEMEVPHGTALPADPGAGLRRAETALELEPGSVRLHPTIRLGTVLVEFAFRSHRAEAGRGPAAAARSRIEAEARARALGLAAWLRAGLPAWRAASLCHLADECHIDQESAAPAADLGNVAAAPLLPWGFSIADAVAAGAAVEALVEALAPRPPRPGGRWRGRCLDLAAEEVALRPSADEALPVPVWDASWDGEPPERLDAEVCVAGTGAAGGMAMLAATERGRRVVAVDANRILGGTHTVGRVVAYYHGHQGGANAAAAEAAGRLAAAAIAAPPPGGLPHALLLDESAALAVVLGGTRVCGARVEGGRLARTIVANEDGLCAISAAVSIDATGNADLAVLAGAATECGDSRDGMLQSFSMWGTEVYPAPHFFSCRCLGDPGVYQPGLWSEHLRAIAIAHRDPACSAHQISPMVTPREGRRIVGEAALTLEDVQLRRAVPDALAVACTSADSHAFTSSDLGRIGGMGGGEDLPVLIPFGCFIPRGIEGLLVGGKAISGERDATSFCRMNADVKNAGYALGAAAAMAAAIGRGVRAVDLTALRQELRRLGVLPEWAFAERPAPSVAAAVARLGEGGPAALCPLLALPAAAALAELERAFTDAPPDEGFHSRRSLLVQALAWHGSATGAAQLARLLHRAMDEGRHLTPPSRRAPRLHQGWQEDDARLVDRLATMAGRSGGQAEVRAALARLVEATPGAGEAVRPPMPYDASRRDIAFEPFANRLLVLAYAVERKAGPELAPAMEELLARPGVAGHHTLLGARTAPLFLSAHREFRLAVAAWRCGAPHGREILERYRNDAHAFLRRTARALLPMPGR